MRLSVACVPMHTSAPVHTFNRLVIWWECVQFLFCFFYTGFISLLTSNFAWLEFVRLSQMDKNIVCSFFRFKIVVVAAFWDFILFCYLIFVLCFLFFALPPVLVSCCSPPLSSSYLLLVFSRFSILRIVWANSIHCTCILFPIWFVVGYTITYTA